jgi:hypothetical protein
LGSKIRVETATNDIEAGAAPHLQPRGQWRRAHRWATSADETLEPPNHLAATRIETVLYCAGHLLEIVARDHSPCPNTVIVTSGLCEIAAAIRLFDPCSLGNQRGCLSDAFSKLVYMNFRGLCHGTEIPAKADYSFETNRRPGSLQPMMWQSSVRRGWLLAWVAVEFPPDTTAKLLASKSGPEDLHFRSTLVTSLSGRARSF